jgi:PAS domain S-box-containing protein
MHRPLPPTATKSIRDPAERLAADASLRVLVVALFAAAAALTLWFGVFGRSDGDFGRFHMVHTGVEFISVAAHLFASVLAFVVVTRTGNRNILVLAAALLGAAACDFLHFLNVPDVPVKGGSAEPGRAYMFWVVGRVLSTSALVFAAFASWRPRVAPTPGTLVLWAAPVAAIIGLLVAARPDSPLASAGTSLGPPVDIVSEIGILAIAVVAAYGFLALSILRPADRPVTLRVEPAPLLAASVSMAMSSLFTLLAPDVHGLTNAIGHGFKATSAVFLAVGVLIGLLRQIDQQYESALDAGAIGVWSLDLETGAFEADGRARHILSLPQTGPLGTSDADKPMTRDDIDRRDDAIRSATAPGGTGRYRIEYPIRSDERAPSRWVRSEARVEYETGYPARLVGLVTDITPTHLADELVRRSEAKFAGIVAMAADAIISIDTRGHITLFNDGAETIFGYRREEALGQPLTLLLPHRFRDRHDGHVATFARSGVGARKMGERAAIFGLRKSGEEFAAEASISHLSLDGEDIFTVVLRDVAERKKFEAELARGRLELEERVAERTKELSDEMRRREETQARLIQAQRMEAFGQLTGGIAHDFNNLLTIVTGNLELLEMRLKDEKQLQLAKRAMDAAEMGGRLTARLLTFARRRKFETQAINLNEVIIGLADLLRRTLGEPITVETRFASGLWPVAVDPSEIENAIINLAINSRDAMPKGGLLIITTRNATSPGEALDGGMRLAPGDYVSLAVTDTGTGMAPETAARAFEPFFTTKAHGRGTGLGLSTVYGLVRQQGGAIGLSSHLEQGTTVTLYLPRVSTEHAENRVDQDPMVLSRAAGERILLVEDNAEVRDVTRQRLEGLGYQVIEAETGTAAIAALEAGADVEIVFSDIVMVGGVSGFDVARWVRRHRPGLALLLATGYAEEALRERSADLNDIPIMDKPYSRADLAAALGNVLKH